MNDKIRYEIFHTLNCGCEIKKANNFDPHSYECNFCNCIWKPEKFRTSTGFEPSQAH